MQEVYWAPINISLCHFGYFLTMVSDARPFGNGLLLCACSVTYCYLIVQQLLNEEIAVLKEKVEHHPDVTRFAMENLELRGKQ